MTTDTEEAQQHAEHADHDLIHQARATGLDGDAAPPRRRRRVRAALGAAAALIAVGAAAAAAVGFGIGVDSGDPAPSAAPAPATVTISKRTLLDTETKDGRLGFGPPHTVAGKAAGTLTSLPATGATIGRGQPLVKVDERPVVVLYGPLPAYRTLAPGAVGADVAQFEENLAALGYDGFAVDSEYTTETGDAVTRWQSDLGLDPDGQLTPDRVVYTAGEIRVEALAGEVGDAAQPGAPLLTYTGTAPLISVTLDIDEARLAKTGSAVSFRTPDGTRATGKITAVETVIATTASPNGPPASETKIELTVAADDTRALAAYDAATIDVEFTAAQRPDVLAVPVAALLALPAGGYGLQVIDGTAARVVGVQTGLFAAGWVEVSGAELAEGMVVGTAE